MVDFYNVRDTSLMDYERRCECETMKGKWKEERGKSYHDSSEVEQSEQRNVMCIETLCIPNDSTDILIQVSK